MTTAAVTMVVGDICGIGVEVLHMVDVDVDFIVGIVGAGVARDVEIHVFS